MITFRCKQCSYSSFARRPYLRHLVTKKHGPYRQFSKLDFKPHKCTHCSFASDGAKKLTLHIMKTHNDDSGVLQPLSANATSTKSRKDQTKSTKRIVGKMCHISQDGSSKRPMEAMNEVKHYSIYGKIISIFQCSECEYFSKSKHSFLRHAASRGHGSCFLDGVNFDPRPKKCSYCSFATDGKKKLSLHIQLKHTKKKNSLQEELKEKRMTRVLYSCKECPYKSEKKAILDAHIHSQHDPEQLSVNNKSENKQNQSKGRLLWCSVCDAKMENAKDMDKHNKFFHTFSTSN